MMDTETLLEKVNAFMETGELDEDDEEPKGRAEKKAFFTERPPYKGTLPECFLQFTLPDIDECNDLHGMRGCLQSAEENVFLLVIGKAIPLCCVYYKDALKPLLQFLADKSYSLEFFGDVADELFHVNEMHIVTGEREIKQFPASPFHLKDRHFQVLLQYRLEHGDASAEEDSLNSSVLFSTPGELKLLYEFCKNAYPPNIREWAENKFSTLSAAHLGSTDKRHILKCLSYILNVDWSMQPPQVPDADQVRRALDEQFFGLETVKQRIMEVAAQIRQTHSLPKWGILLNGPAGVGKTSIAKAIARILGMKDVYLDFSVIRDSEGLTGSYQIYDNGKPGMILEKICACRTANLVMVLNEIDKAASGKDRGNPLDTLLPLLDGMGFTDTYIELSIPTNGIFFVATCNDVSKISRPVLDRFYRIDIPAYGTQEKEIIFDDYIFPKALQQVRLDARELTLSPEARDELFSQYAVQPGVRDLERFAERMTSNYLLQKEKDHLTGFTHTAESIRQLLGPAQVINRALCMFPGMAIGAFCNNGEVHTFQVQAVLRPGSGELNVVHVPGEHQKEYCRAAYICAGQLFEGKLDKADVTMGVTDPIPDSQINYIGAAACAAICSAVKGVPFSSREIFLGGCDFFGNLYLDEKTIDPYIKCLAGRFHTFYGPMGTAQLVYENQQHQRMNIVETPNMSVLFELIGARNSSD